MIEAVKRKKEFIKLGKRTYIKTNNDIKLIDEKKCALHPDREAFKNTGLCPICLKEDGTSLKICHFENCMFVLKSGSHNKYCKLHKKAGRNKLFTLYKSL